MSIECDRGANFFLYPLTWAFSELVQKVFFCKALTRAFVRIVQKTRVYMDRRGNFSVL
nr:MAG TPA: hypothetical protein [Caudoviricetes sp.]